MANLKMEDVWPDGNLCFKNKEFGEEQNYRAKIFVANLKLVTM